MSDIRLFEISGDGAFLRQLPQQVDLDSITRQLPDGYYSTFRTYGGCTRVLGLTSHLRRLYDYVSTPAASASTLRQQLTRLLQSLRPDEARVRVVMTRQGQIYIAIEPLKPLPMDVYEKGVRVETTEIRRNTPRMKSTAFINSSQTERVHLAQQGIFEALLVKNGMILEGMTSNFFYVLRQDAASLNLRTSQRDILLGVTRRIVIRLARGRGVQVKYQPLKLDQLTALSESFITSSSRGVVPVVQIDNVTVGQGSPGPITSMLRLAYEDYVLKHAEKI